MTKAENRAAAKAYHQERMRKIDEGARAKAVESELVELDRLRRYLIRERTLGYVRPLINAIDDYVEQITGDRTRLHAKNHSIGR
ncbi:hypothetical protein ABID58_006759 [Bradyrhizobium sp. S3.2.6]|uniref:hypothetical protein n=1 Tax=Bradyrhizobium sp. S3.2.6 TaxID=3156428 RepID=UPI0033988C00